MNQTVQHTERVKPLSAIKTRQRGNGCGSIARILPDHVADAITGLFLQDHQKNSALRLVSAIYRKYTNTGMHFEDYAPISYHWYTKAGIIGTKDTKRSKLIVDKLITSNILQIGRDYTKPEFQDKKKVKDGECRLIRINPELIRNSTPVVIKLRSPQKQRKLDLLQITAREHLQKLSLKLPSKYKGDVRAFVESYVYSETIQSEIKESIEEINFYPASCMAVLERSARKLHSRQEIKDYKRKEGMKLYRIKKKNKYSYYLSTIEDLVKYKSLHYFHSAMSGLLRINHVKDFNNIVSRNETNGRLDSILTNLFSEFLAFVVCDDEEIIWIDLVNSQFTIFANMLNEALKLIEGWGKMSTGEKKAFLHSNNNNIYIEDDKREIVDILPYKFIFKTNNKEYKILNKIKDKEINNLLSYLAPKYSLNNCKSNNCLNVKMYAELKTFIRECQTGGIYEYIVKASKGRLNRKEAKGLMFQLFFDTYDTKNCKANRKLLESIFPNVVGLVDHMKKGKEVELLNTYKRNKKRLKEDLKHLAKKHHKTLKSLTDSERKAFAAYKMGNNWFSNLLQKTEVQIFIDTIAKKVQRRYWCASKHDSIGVLKSDFKAILKLIQKDLDKIFGQGNYMLRKEQYSYCVKSDRITKHQEDVQPTGEAPGMQNTEKAPNIAVDKQDPLYSVYNSPAFRGMTVEKQKQFLELYRNSNST